ncbi:MAG: S4 domain-containing protein [Caulobacterales bacterium]
MTGPSGAQAPPPVRLDVWLWRARFFKSRTTAAAAVAAGAVRVGRATPPRRVEKPAFSVQMGDVLVFATPDGQVHAVEVLGFGVRRGPPAEARALYRHSTGLLDET